jgi:hypothetical protein
LRTEASEGVAMAWMLNVPVLLAGLTAVGQPERPEELVKAAVTAAGGAETLAKYPAGRVVGKGTMTFAGVETALSFEQVYRVPGRFRTVVRCEVQGQKWELVQVVDGATAKQTINGRVVALNDPGLRELQLAVLLNEVAQLTPLAADRRFVLKTDKQLKGPDAAGLIVHVKGYPELRLAFDRKAGHLVRIAYKDTDPDTAKEADTEIAFAEFQTVSGLTRPTRSVVTRGGKPVADLTVEKFTPLEKVDPKVFTIED